MKSAQPPTTKSRHDSDDDRDAARGPEDDAMDDAMIGVSELAARGVMDASSSALMRWLRSSPDRCPCWRLRPSIALLSPPRTRAYRRTATALAEKRKQGLSQLTSRKN